MPLIIPWKLVLAGAVATGASASALASDPAALHLPGRQQSGARCTSDAGRAVCRLTRDQHVRDAMLLGALLEGGRLDGPWECGDGGWSCGPWQINRSPSAHPGVTRAQSADPAWAARYMIPAYRRACASVGAAQWQADRRSAAATCVFRAERPAAMYLPARVRAAWAQLDGR